MNGRTDRVIPLYPPHPHPETLLARGIKNVIIISHNALLWNVGWLGILLLWRFASFHLQGKYTVDLSHQKHVFLSYNNTTTTTTTTMQQRICYTKPSLSNGWNNKALYIVLMGNLSLFYTQQSPKSLYQRSWYCFIEAIIYITSNYTIIELQQTRIHLI